MPQVPGITPTQGVSGSGTPEINFAVPVEAFGGAVGQAVSHLGGALEQAGDKVWQEALRLQDLQNRTEVDKADADYMEKAGKLHAEFSSLQGENATKAFPQYIADLKSAREEIRGGLSNPAVARLYDSQTLSTMGRTIFNGAGHAGQQAKVAQLDALSAKQSSLTSMAASSDDPEFQEWARKRLTSIVQQKHAIKGTPESIPDEMQAVNSSLATNVVIHKAYSDPVGAFDELETLRKQGKLTDEDYNRAYSRIAPRRQTMIAQNIADDVYNSGVKDGQQTKSLKDLQEQARAAAAKQAPDDALMQQHAVNAVDARYNQQRAAENDAKNRNNQTIDAAIATGEVKSVRDLQNNPATAPAYDALPDSVKRALPGRINSYQRTTTDYISRQNYEQLKGMALNGDPAVQAQFMDIDINALDNLNRADKNHLIELRGRMLKKEETDTRVGRAMGWLRTSQGAELERLRIYRRDAHDPDEYDRFVGSLHSALEDWQQTHGKPASQTDITEKIGPMLLKGRGDAGWFSSESHEYNVPPQEIVDQLQAGAEKRGLPRLSDREIQRAYVQALLKKNYPSAKQQQDAAK